MLGKGGISVSQTSIFLSNLLSTGVVIDDWKKFLRSRS